MEWKRGTGPLRNSARTGSVQGPRDYRRCLSSVWSRRRPCAHRSFRRALITSPRVRALPPAPSRVWHKDRKDSQGFARISVCIRLHRYTRRIPDTSRSLPSFHVRYMNSQDQRVLHGVRVERGKNYGLSLVSSVLRGYYPLVVYPLEERRASRTRISLSKFYHLHAISEFTF